MDKLTKALKLLSNDKIFMEGETDKYTRFIVIGNKDNYEVIYDKRKDIYNCTCKNIHIGKDCYHISACKILRYAYDFKDKQED